MYPAECMQSEDSAKKLLDLIPYFFCVALLSIWYTVILIYLFVFNFRIYFSSCWFNINFEKEKQLQKV